MTADRMGNLARDLAAEFGDQQPLTQVLIEHMNAGPVIAPTPPIGPEVRSQIYDLVHAGRLLEAQQLILHGLSR